MSDPAPGVVSDELLNFAKEETAVAEELKNPWSSRVERRRCHLKHQASQRGDNFGDYLWVLFLVLNSNKWPLFQAFTLFLACNKITLLMQVEHQRLWDLCYCDILLLYLSLCSHFFSSTHDSACKSSLNKRKMQVKSHKRSPVGEISVQGNFQLAASPSLHAARDSGSLPRFPWPSPGSWQHISWGTHLHHPGPV